MSDCSYDLSVPPLFLLVLFVVVPLLRILLLLVILLVGTYVAISRRMEISSYECPMHALLDCMCLLSSTFDCMEDSIETPTYKYIKFRYEYITIYIYIYI